MSLETLRKSREFWVTGSDGREYLIRRPGLLRWQEIEDLPLSQRVGEFVIDWRGVTMLMIGGTGSDQAPFDAQLCAEFLGDKIKDWNAVYDATRTKVLDAFREEEDAEKKSDAS